MAAGTTLVLAYETSSGSTTQHSWKYAKTSPTLANVKALMSATITNGSIFGNVPVLAKSAKVVTTTETELDLEAVMTADGKDSRALIAPKHYEDGEEITVETTLETKAAKRARLERELAELG